MHGTLHQLSEPLQEHPGGRCKAIPKLRDHDAPVLASGEARLRALPVAAQRKILGPALHEAWRDGAVGLGDVVGVRQSSVWGGSIRVRPLAEIVGAERAAGYVRFARVMAQNPQLSHLEGVDLNLFKAAVGEMELSTEELQAATAQVAEQGFDTEHLTRSGRTAAEDHFRKHVQRNHEWPLHTTEEQYLESLGDAVRDADYVFTERYRGQWQVGTLTRVAGRDVGDKGAWTLVKYRLEIGRWVTGFRPHETLEQIIADLLGEELRWLRRP